jgi:hypothetical protein
VGVRAGGRGNGKEGTFNSVQNTETMFSLFHIFLSFFRLTVFSSLIFCLFVGCYYNIIIHINSIHSIIIHIIAFILFV